MTTTTSAYLTVLQNLPKMQTMTADEPAVKTAGSYYAANIGSVTSISSFVSNYRLLSYALDAYGLSDQINSKALITQVLQGGVSNPKSLANTLTNPAWKAFAAAFDFTGKGVSSISTSGRSHQDDEQLCRAAVGKRPGRTGPRRSARALFPARRAYGPPMATAYWATRTCLKSSKTIFWALPRVQRLQYRRGGGDHF